MKSPLAIGLLLAQLATPTWAGPSPEDFDYSFTRPLLVESKFVNGFRFDIISPEDPFANFEGVRYMAEIYGDNYLIITDQQVEKLIDAKMTGSGGRFSFQVMDQIEEKFGKNDEGYVIVREWGGGRDYTYHVYATKEVFKQILELDTTSDYYEIIAPNQLKFFEPSDIEGLANCSRAEWPYDQVIYTFFPQETAKDRRKAEIPECAKAATGN